MAYLLDTNILSALMRDPRGIVAAHIARVGEANIFTSVIVAAEIHYGINKKQSERLKERAAAILSAIDIVPFTDDMAAIYGDLRAGLESRGEPIGGNDLLIAAQALRMNATLVSDNMREFKRIEGLHVENWLAMLAL